MMRSVWTRRASLAGLLTLSFALSLTGAGCGRLGQDDHRVMLAVPFAAQETLLCVPTAASMVLTYYGDPQPPRKLKVLASGRLFDPAAPFNDFTITPYDGLVQGLRTLGYDWVSTNLPMTPEGFSNGMAQIEADLREGRPTLVDVSYDGVGHTLVVVGFDARRQVIHFVDPAASAPGRSSASFAQFEQAWNETAYRGRFRAMIRTQKRAGPSV